MQKDLEEMKLNIHTIQCVFEKEEEIKLTALEFDLLVLFLDNINKSFSRDEILDKVWGIDYVGESRTVDVHIRHLRQKIGQTRDGEEYIETIRGRGYKLK